MTQALYFIVSTLAQLVLLLFLLRFWLPMLRVDFRNPLAQGVLRLTSPLVVPVRRLLPPVGRVDTATVLVLFVLQVLVVLLLLVISGRMADPLSIAITAIVQLAVHSLYLFFFVVLISVVLSWIAPQTYNPVISMISSMAEPILRPFRKILPSLGGLDISPIFAIILLQAGVILLRSLQPFPV
ncbi:MAG: YggT family protein [Woeseia sp.]